MSEVLRKQCFDAMKEVLGDNHPNTLTTMHNLAATYADQAKYSDAEVLYKQCLAKMKIVLGENHPQTIGTKENLACNYANQGKYSEADSVHPGWRRSVWIEGPQNKP